MCVVDLPENLVHSHQKKKEGEREAKNLLVLLLKFLDDKICVDQDFIKKIKGYNSSAAEQW